MSSEQVRENLKEARLPPEAEQQSCPTCQAVIPVHPGYPTWCHECGWNLDVRQPPRQQGLFEKLSRSISKKSSLRLFEQVVKSGSRATALNPAKALAFLLAGCVHGLTILFVALGIWLCVSAFPTTRFLGFFLGAGCFLVAWLLLPGLPKAPTSTLPREQFPILYQITDRIAQALGSPAVDSIACDFQFNAAFGQFGWRRKRLLKLGLPLFVILEGQEKVALLSHELAHAVSGDPNRGLFLCAATYSLARWYELLRPQGGWDDRVYSVHRMVLLWGLVTWPLAAMIWLVGYALSHLVWYDSQRAKYRADLLAAQVSGTAAILAVLDKMHLEATFRHHLRLAYLRRKGQDFFVELRRQVVCVPARELERIRRIEMLTDARLDASHPPTTHRLEFLKAHGVPKAKITLSPAELARLEQELAPLLHRAQQQIFDLDELTFRERFGLGW